MFLNILTIVLLNTGEILTDGVDDLCDDVVSKYNCNHFVPKRLCGSDGILYQTECDFAKAHCKHRHLTIVSEGDICGHGGTGGTVSGGSDNFKRVCEVIVSNYDCSRFQHKLLCGSDGNEYHSECAFTKAHCRNPHLSIVREGGPCHPTTIVKTTVITTTKTMTPTTTAVETLITTTKPISIAPSVASTTIGGSQPPVHTDKPTSGQPVTHINTDHATMTVSGPHTTLNERKTTVTQPDTTVMTTAAPTPPPTLDPILCQVLLGASCPPNGPRVCGSDSKTYANTCELEKQSCKTPEVHQKSEGECHSSFNFICRAVLEHPCPVESEPVCGTNSLQFNNLCEYQKAKCVDPDLTISHSGPCV